MKKIVLGVTSSISIYKACEILRRFQDNGIQVQVIMTRNATRLISPQLFSALSGCKTLVDLFGEDDGDRIAHVSLAEEASLLVVAPATANIIAKFASGVADDFLSTFYTSVRCRVLIAPAMNEAMYLHPQTQANIRKLRGLGVEFVLPEKGYLACKEEGWGRLATPNEIIERGMELLRKSESLRRKRIVVTAGPTREPLDPVRFLSNRSSGKMGYELAAEALRRGGEVVLISGPTALIPPAKATVINVQTAAEMAREVYKNLPGTDVLVMAAAVSDFRFESAAPQKIKKSNAPAKVGIVRTEDILTGVRRKKRKKGLVVVGFAAETEDVRRNALAKLREKELELIVANDVSSRETGFESDFNQVLLIDKRGVVTDTGRLTKREISRLIMDKIEDLLERKN
ncbi:MAG: bifunctional phosphopantothenoylcysteine decarboxylase/phosphopantothenate--cysteine ligase CoaBC [Clostridiales bacterium]|nr:bifunctional phosphopantothenoylcysteine decarboxylase/phosphopantothenate--cysteine ligase CoaBC [Clostridiales bacterium]